MGTQIYPSLVSKNWSNAALALTLLKHVVLISHRLLLGRVGGLLASKLGTVVVVANNKLVGGWTAIYIKQYCIVTSILTLF
jgi:hypothetical protein